MPKVAAHHLNLQPSAKHLMILCKAPKAPLPGRIRLPPPFRILH